MRATKVTVFILLGLGIMASFFTNMDFLNPDGTLLKKESIKVSPEPLADVQSRNSTDLWSCACTQKQDSDCSQGQSFKSMREAAAFSKQVCGDDCNTVCAVKHDGRSPATASSEEEVEPVAR